MRAAFPAMRLTVEGRWGCIWDGPLVGLDRPYLLRLTHICSPTLGGCDLDWRLQLPRAQVLAPDLVAECGRRLPHVYGIVPYPDLCVFDPHASGQEWRNGMLIAESYIFWVARWLASYELWLVTRKWSGPERHPPCNNPKDACCSGESAAPGAISLAAVRRIARGERTEGSEPVLRAAAEVRLPSLLLDW